MTEFWDGNNGEVQESNAMKALREKADSDSARLKTLEETNSKLLSRINEQDIRAVVESKGLPGKVAKLAAAAGVEPTTEAVEAWVAEYGDVFGIKPADATSQEPSGAGAATPAANVSVEEQAALASMAAGASGGTGAPLTGVSAVQAAINSAPDEEALLKLIYSNPKLA